MEIYLIRHTRPAVDKGICYGQSDIDVVDSFEAEATLLQQHLPAHIQQVHSSPLQRCRKLAERLFPGSTVEYHPDWMELNCGEWELRKWDDIPREALQPWMDDFVNVAIPGGESYVHLYQRVVSRLEEVAAARVPAAIVAHGGVLRSILAYVTATPLVDSFETFKIHYGCVVRLIQAANGKWQYHLLHNIPTAAETHKPSAW